ncbi:MAG: hypothetical protein AB1505_06890 [Candidatus Latescibacterota bacterium]
MPTTLPPTDSEPVSAELRAQLLSLLGDRLSAGQVLTLPARFHQAMEEGYAALAGSVPSESVRQALRDLVDQVNADSPQTFVIPGIENWITQSLLAVAQQQQWDVTEAHERMPAQIRDLLRQEKARNLLAQWGIATHQLNTRECLRAIVNQVAGKDEPQRRGAEARLAQAMARLRRPAPAGTQERLERLLCGPACVPNEEEVARRQEEQGKLHRRLRQEQLEHLMQNLEVYVRQGKLDAEDAERLRSLRQVDQAVGRGEMAQERGSRIRNSILAGPVRDRLERRVREAVDWVVIYQQVFQSLQKIDTRLDPALRFLIRRKECVNAEVRGGDGWAAMTEDLIGDLEVLRRLIDIMDRQDAEVRMLAARLPPYNQVVKRGHERLQRVLVQEGFVDELRTQSGAQVAGRLRSPDRREGLALAAAMLSVHSLVNRVIKPTPLRKEIRILKVNLIIEEFYSTTEDLVEARRRAQEFLRTRLHALYPDLTQDEAEAIQERGAQVIEAAESRAMARIRARHPEGEPGSSTPAEVLTERDAARGAQLGRVAVRTGAGVRLVPFVILPDEEDPRRYVLARRDPQSGELAPVVRRGARRYVARNREGVWEEA